MGDELLGYYREYGPPPKTCDYETREDGATVISTPMEAACLSDFSDLAFFKPPDPKRKLKTTWRK